MKSRKEGQLVCSHGFKGPSHIFSFPGDPQRFIYASDNVVAGQFEFPSAVRHIDRSNSYFAACDSRLCLVWDESMRLCYANTSTSQEFQAVMFSSCERFLALITADGAMQIADISSDFLQEGIYYGFHANVVFLHHRTVVDVESQCAHVLQAGRNRNTYDLEQIPGVGDHSHFIAYRDWWGDDQGYLWRLETGNNNHGHQYLLRRVNERAHLGGICAVNANITAGKDSTIILWSDAAQMLRRVSTAAPCNCVCKEGGAVEFGNRVFNFDTNEEVTGTHSKVIAICIRPSQPDEYSSIGDDGSARVWRGNHLVHELTISERPRLTTCTYNHGEHLAIGTADGRVVVFEHGDMFVPLNTKVPAEIVILVYSLDDRRLAVCNSTAQVYFYETYDFCGMVDLNGSVPQAVHFAEEDEVVKISLSEESTVYVDSVSTQVIPETTLERSWVEAYEDTGSFSFLINDTVIQVFKRDEDVQRSISYTGRLPSPSQTLVLPEFTLGQSVELPVYFNENDFITYIASRHLVCFDPSRGCQMVINTFEDTVRLVSVCRRQVLVITDNLAHFVDKSSGEITASWPMEEARVCALSETSCCAVFKACNELEWVDLKSCLSITYSNFDEDLSVTILDLSGRHQVLIGFEDFPDLWVLQVLGTALVKTKTVCVGEGVPVVLNFGLVGTSTGSIGHIGDGDLSAVFQAHRESITAIYSDPCGLVVTASEDPEIKVWKNDDCIFIASLTAPTVSLDMDVSGTVILTDAAQIYGKLSLRKIQA